MKVTYLINKEQTDGSVILTIGTKEELRKILLANKGLAVNQRRNFIADYISNGTDMDCIIVEVSVEEYRRFNREHMASERNRKLMNMYCHISLDDNIHEQKDLTAEDILADDLNLEETITSEILMEELKDRLSNWKPWATDMLEIYLNGQKRSCTKVLSEKYGVSEQVIRKYKRQFEDFIKNFLSGVSF